MIKLYACFERWFGNLCPAHALLFGYLFYILVTFLILSLPICWKTQWISPLDNFFMATSVISTTTLTPFNITEAYNFFGEIIILIGIQIGGLGYMTLGSYAILASKGHLSQSRINIGKAIFTMPESFRSIQFFRHIITFTVTIELFGTLLLWQAFTEAGVTNPLWAAVFHSIAAFCTAGCSIFPHNLDSFSSNVKVSLIISFLSLLGAIGFIVLDDVYRSFNRSKWNMTLTSRIILVSTFGAITVGTVLLFFDTKITELPIKERALVAFFQTVSALTTTGFHTFPTINLAPATAMVVIILMILGASPSGTGGGLKSTTWSAAIATILSFIHGRDEITFFGYKIPHGRITAAFATFALYLVVFSIGTYLLLLFDKQTFEDSVFEVAAALGTVGLSRGITPDLSVAGKFLIIVIMFIGRLGVVSLALGAVASYHHDDLLSGGKKSKEPEKVGDIVL